MPLYDFFCPSCQAVFEDICDSNSESFPPCPSCGATQTQRKLSAPSPTLTNPFPYKIGPKHPLADKMAAGGGASCPSAGSCGSAGGSGFS